MESQLQMKASNLFPKVLVLTYDQLIHQSLVFKNITDFQDHLVGNFSPNV
jgi:hypothetical protein